MSQVTIADVAEQAGLSSSSVSRILRGGKGHVYSPATVERVQEVASRMGYRVNVAARLLSQGSQTMIGMAVHFTEHPYLNRFLVAVHHELMKHDYDPVLLDSKHLASENMAQPFPPPHMLAGLISMGVDLQRSWPRHYAALAEEIPIVAVQPVSCEAASHVDVVQVDCPWAYSQTVNYLYGLGHRHVAFLGVIENCYPSDQNKLDSWVEAMRSSGLNPKYRIAWNIAQAQNGEGPATLEGPSDFIYVPSSRSALVHVVEEVLSFPDKVTALVCASDEVALVLQTYLQSIGWKLPRDLSIVGYDGISLGEHVYPSLTTISPNYELMAGHAVAQLLHRIREKNWLPGRTPANILVQPHLLIRESSDRVS